MKKITAIIACMLLAGNLFATVNWDILDKTMNPWNANGGAATNKAWAFTKGSNTPAAGIVTQEAGYVNIKKTNTGSSNHYGFLTPPAMTLAANTVYTFEVKARVKPTDKQTYPDGSTYYESNQISARLNGKNMAIHLKYGNANTGYISIGAGLSHSAAEKYVINTSEWHRYRIVFHADNTTYDVYIDDMSEPVFENAPAVTMTGTNILRLGAETSHRCNMDIEYAKMGTGAFYSKTKIVSVVLNAEGQTEENAKVVAVTAHTLLINDNEKLLISLVDGEDNSIVDAVEAVVLQNKAVINFTIPAGLPRGKYFVKAAAPNGKIGDIDIRPRVAEYFITSSAFEGKNLATFGNSITAAANSWAYLTQKRLRFANLYNGAISAAIWYKRERVVAGQTIWTQNYYDADFAGISSVAPTGENVLEHQRRINNCAVVHIQKFFTELNKKTTPKPDFIIFSYGTNDELYEHTMGNAEDALREEDLSKVNVFTMAGALRWCIDTLRKEIPDAKIYVALPLQSSRDGKNEGNLIKMEIIKKICDARQVPYFDCFHESGITLENHTTYLGDGLHPNEAGKIVHGEYIVKKLEEAESGHSAVVQEKVRNECISISDNVLKAGKSLSVKALRDASSLVEMTLYGMAGNTVCRKAVSGNECTFNVPAVAGMYLLTVRLADSTSKGFKILVK